LLYHRAYDDPFITYRYADNLRRGLGFVYNPNEYVLSTTTPLYTLLLTVLSYLWSDLPRLSNFISAISVTLGGLFLLYLGRAWKAPVAGIVAAILFPFFPLLLSTFGAEMSFFLMLVLAAFLLYANDQPVWAMVPAALATLTRSDGVLVAGILGFDMLLHQRKFPWRMVVLYSVLIAPWYLFSWVYFGSPFPVTLAAKQYQGAMAISQRFAQGGWTMLVAYARNPFYWFHGVFFCLGMGYAFAKKRQYLLLTGWGFVYFLGYTILGVSSYFWYYAPFVPVIIGMVGLGVQWLIDHLPASWQANWRCRGLVIILLVLMLWPQYKGVRWLSNNNDNRFDIYQAVGIWLAEHLPPQVSVGTLEIGIIGYYARLPMVDFAGLLQPEVALQMQRESTYQDTAIWATQQYAPDYLVLNPGWFPRLMEAMVSNSCVVQAEFSDPNYPGILQVYQCQWPSTE